MGFIDPTEQGFAQFRANDRPGPIHMLNLVRLRAQASYPDGRIATGRDAYAAYGRESAPVFQRVGGRIVWPVYREAVKHRQAAVEDSRLARHAVLAVGNSFGEVPRVNAASSTTPT